jgi:hypothetical protein
MPEPESQRWIASEDRVDADGTDQPQSTPSRRNAVARTLLVRCWIEPTADASPRLRGTVSELSGEQLGAFETLPGLAALLRRILAPIDDGQHPA